MKKDLCCQWNIDRAVEAPCWFSGAEPLLVVMQFSGAATGNVNGDTVLAQMPDLLLLQRKGVEV